MGLPDNIAVAVRSGAGWGFINFPNPPTSADVSATYIPVVVNPIAVNQEPPVPNRGNPVVTTKNADGSTATAHGTVARSVRRDEAEPKKPTALKN